MYMILVLVIIIYIIIGYVEIYHLYHRKQKKEIVLYTITLAITFIASSLLSLGVKLPSPTRAIDNILTNFLGK